MSAKIIYGKPIAENILNHATQTITSIKKEKDINPTIATILVGDDAGSRLYMRLRDKACKQVGIQSIHHELSKDTSEHELISLIQKLNRDASIHGLLIQLPLPKHIDQQHIISAINPKKDVEGFTSTNLGTLINNQETIIPCTPLAVLKILDAEDIKVKAKHIVIINHSMVVGKPLAVLLLNRNATVSICHEFTKNLRAFTTQADILITAAGKQHLITKKHIKKDAIVIDVSIIPTDKGIMGDVDMQDIKDTAAAITPVPGGVGPVTVACAIENMVKTIHHCHGDKKK